MSVRPATVVSVGLLLCGLLILSACGDPQGTPPPPGLEGDCFGTGDLTLAPTAELTVDRETETAIGGEIHLPRDLPDYVTAIESGLVQPSFGKGKPAFVLKFRTGTANQIDPSTQLLFADRRVCVSGPEPPQLLDVGGQESYVTFDDGTDTLVANTVTGVLRDGSTYVSIRLVWFGPNPPGEAARVDALADWIRRLPTSD